MTSITSLTLEVADSSAAAQFYDAAFDLGILIRFRESTAATTGFRAFTISLIASQPSTVSALFDSAIAAGASAIKPVEKSMWGYGGTLRAPDGTIWKIATSSKKDTGRANRTVDQVVILLGVDDVKASKRFYIERGLEVGRSFGSYVDFAMPNSPITLGLYKRAALAKDAGVPPEGTGSHRVAIASNAGSFTDPDGFAWEVAEPATAPQRSA